LRVASHDRARSYRCDTPVTLRERTCHASAVGGTALSPTAGNGAQPHAARHTIPTRARRRRTFPPRTVVSHPLGATYQVWLAQTVISRHVLQPGWSWEKHARPSAGTPSCELSQRGVVLSGRMGVRTDDGEELIIGPNHIFDLPPT
jgi:hypothetical protein